MSAKALVPLLVGVAALATAAWVVPTLDPGSGSGSDATRPAEPAPPAVAAPPPAAPAARPLPRIVWRDSRSLGSPSAGVLVRGMRLPVEGPDFFTWDPVQRERGNRAWRRFGADGTIRRVLRVVRAHRRAERVAPRVGIGDISRPRGGDFGARYGLPGHSTHQSGLDVDLYYPRRDRRELAPVRVGQVDRRLSQDLVDRFVAAGAELVLVGPATGLRGPSGVVIPYVNHDNHLHVRFPPHIGAP